MSSVRAALAHYIRAVNLGPEDIQEVLRFRHVHCVPPSADFTFWPRLYPPDD